MLPALNGPYTYSGGSATVETQTTARRVLVIDDDQSLIDLIADALHLVGHYEVVIARDGVEGLERYYVHQPDCVIVDVRMPNLNGFHFVRAVRGDPNSAQTPIIILSAMVQDRDRLNGLMSGADAYLIKPVKMVDLLEAIKKALIITPEERAVRTSRFASDT